MYSIIVLRNFETEKVIFFLYKLDFTLMMVHMKNGIMSIQKRNDDIHI